MANHAKKVKFNHESEIEEEAIEISENPIELNGEDSIDEAAKAGQKPRRRVLKEDGLSDSDETNSDVEIDRHGKVEREKSIREEGEEDFQAVDGEDVDMFTIEPNEFSTLNDMPITPFNLNEEREEGTFDEEGNFIWHSDSDPDELPELVIKTAEDRATARQMHKKAFYAQQRRKQEIKQKEEEWETIKQKIGLPGIIKELLGFLEGRETPLQALKRLAPTATKKPLVRRYVKPSTGTTSLEDSNKSSIDRITTLCSDAIALGLLTVYEETPASMQHMLQRLEKPAKRPSFE